ncbi:hypothetical protein, partial [Staphylococcus epidermidis]|uniref:hypothetical protein n=1 Tax=Staphylococcus epidermidis TaxID=1282 RepID=UPI0011A52DBA
MGKKRGEKIVNRVGENGINDILTGGEMLESVASLGKKKEKEIGDEINGKEECEKIMTGLEEV